MHHKVSTGNPILAKADLKDGLVISKNMVTKRRTPGRPPGGFVVLEGFA